MSKDQISKMSKEERLELWEKYLNELAGNYGFGAPSRWNKGPRNFQAFLVEQK